MNNLSIKNKMIIKMIIALIPLIIYAMYKNGYLLYKDNLISIVEIFKPFLLVVISIIVALGVNYIFDKKIKLDFNVLYGVLIGMIVSPTINIILYILIILISLILLKKYEKKLSFNYVALIYLVFLIINLFINKASFNNAAEASYTFSFNFLDIVLGRSVGGISSTSILFSLCAFVYLSNNIYYKKNIPVIINILYLLCSLLLYAITGNNDLLLNGDVLFGSVFISTLPMYSSYSKKGIFIYSTLIGVLTFIIGIFNKVIAIYIATLLISIIHKKLDNFNLKQIMTK